MSPTLLRKNPFIVLNRILLFILLYVFAFGTTYSQPPATPARFTYLGTYGGHYYYMSEARYKWTEAKPIALANGGYMASVTTPDENQFLFEKIQAPMAAVQAYINGPVWIGLNDATTEGVFVWDNGEPFCYTNWDDGEPNNFDNDEDHVQMLSWNGKWNDWFNDPATASYPDPRIPFIMEFGAPSGPSVSPTQPTCSTPTGSITVTAPSGTGYTYTVSKTGYTSTNSTGVFPGLNPGTYSVTASLGGCTSTATMVTINAVPTGTLSASPSVLWPPNHKMVLITITYPCAAANCTITSVSVNEGDNTTGDGNTVNDIQLIPGSNNTLYLRAERKGNAIGRVYTIHTSCGDVTVTVPHDQSGKTRGESIGSTEINEGSAFNVRILENPSANNFRLQINGSQESVILRVMDIYGKLVENKKVAANNILQLGENYRPGIYFINVIQGNNSKQLKIVKQ